jgi:C_GCAxxG_C_C family probable redox protein
MENIQEQAINTFRSGLNCAQAVLTAYSEKLSFDKDFAISVSCGFGGGMGRLQETCGAVTGAFMVLGIYNSKQYVENKERKDKTYFMVRDFNRKFTDIYHTTSCKGLLGCDLNTDEGQQYAKDHNVHGTICEKCITDAVGIVEEMIK